MDEIKEARRKMKVATLMGNAMFSLADAIKDLDETRRCLEELFKAVTEEAEKE